MRNLYLLLRLLRRFDVLTAREPGRYKRSRSGEPRSGGSIKERSWLFGLAVEIAARRDRSKTVQRCGKRTALNYGATVLTCRSKERLPRSEGAKERPGLEGGTPPTSATI